MAKLFTCERVGFGMRAESDDELAAHVERHMAEAHADLAGKLAALPDDRRSYFAKRLAAVSTTATT
jgi:predicted small metal-binding protein